MKSCSDSNLKETVLANRQRPGPKWTGKIAHFFPSILCGICFLGASVGRALATGSPWLDLIVISVATIATLLVANQRLPLQNVVALVFTVVVFWWATLLVAKASGIFLVPPLFHFRFFREYEFGLFWAVGLINARGIATSLLHRWRKSANFGLWLIGLSALLLVAEDPGAHKNLAYLSGKFLFTAIFLVTATPWFLDKKRTDQKPEYQPLIITILLFLW